MITASLEAFPVDGDDTLRLICAATLTTGYTAVGVVTIEEPYRYTAWSLDGRRGPVRSWWSDALSDLRARGTNPPCCGSCLWETARDS
jgi:hypothetical protein